MKMMLCIHDQDLALRYFPNIMKNLHPYVIIFWSHVPLTYALYLPNKLPKLTSIKQSYYYAVRLCKELRQKEDSRDTLSLLHDDRGLRWGDSRIGGLFTCILMLACYLGPQLGCHLECLHVDPSVWSFHKGLFGLPHRMIAGFQEGTSQREPIEDVLLFFLFFSFFYLLRSHIVLPLSDAGQSFRSVLVQDREVERHWSGVFKTGRWRDMGSGV